MWGQGEALCPPPVSEPHLGDDDFGGVERQRNSRSVRLLLGNTLNVDDPLPPVDRENLSVTSLVGAPDNLNLVILPDRERADLQKSNRSRL